MSLTKLRKKGQVTIPNRIRESMHLVENMPLYVEKMGSAILLTPKKGIFDEVSKEFSARAAQKGITLDQLLNDLKKTRNSQSNSFAESRKIEFQQSEVGTPVPGVRKPSDGSKIRPYLGKDVSVNCETQ